MEEIMITHFISKWEIPIFCYTSDRVASVIEEINFVRNSPPQEICFGNIRIDSTQFIGHILGQDINSVKIQKRDKSHKLTNVKEPHIYVVHGNDNLLGLYKDNQFPEYIVVIGKRSKPSLPNFKTGNSVIVHSTEANLKHDIDLLLERYVIRFLRETIDKTGLLKKENGSYSHDFSTIRDMYVTNGESEDRRVNGTQSNKRSSDLTEPGTLRSGKRFRRSEDNDTPDDDELHTLLQDAMALIERSSVPANKKPVMKCSKPCVLDSKVAHELFAIDTSIDGCGYQHDVLHVYLKRQSRVKLDRKLTSCLHRHAIFKFRFHFGPCTLTPMCGIKVGTQLGKNGRFATLGGFSKNGQHQYVLTARHYVQTLSNNFLYCTLANGGSECFAIIQKRTSSSGELDIAAAQMLPIAHYDFRFKRSSGIFTHSSLFNFQIQNQDESEESEAKITGMLRGEQIFSWTANSSERPKVGRIYIPLYHKPNLQYKYIIIRNLVNNNDTFGQPGDSGAIICRDERASNGVNVIAMFMGQRGGTEEYMTLPLQQGLQQLSTELQGNFQIC